MTTEKKSILVIDDCETLLMTFKHVLENQGYLVTLAVHGKDGLEMLHNMEAPDVVLLDGWLPVLGREE